MFLSIPQRCEVKSNMMSLAVGIKSSNFLYDYGNINLKKNLIPCCRQNDDTMHKGLESVLVLEINMFS